MRPRTVLAHVAAAAALNLSAANLPARSDPFPIAHAGGAYEDRVYTNSLAAADRSYALGHRLFEFDLIQTSDGRLVCAHDFDAFGKQLSFVEFDRWRRTQTPVPCIAEELQEWMRAHRDAFLVTDTKSYRRPYGTRSYKLIAALFGENLDQVIPQIYHPQQYAPVRKLGFTRVIWTVYGLTPRNFPPEKVKAAADRMELLALTVPWQWAERGYASALVGVGVPLYSHTINTCEHLERLRAVGISGVYSDHLPPGACPIRQEQPDPPIVALVRFLSTWAQEPLSTLLPAQMQTPPARASESQARPPAS